MRRFFFILLLLALPTPAPAQTSVFLIKKGDRIAWIGSSSTAIGVWPKTMEFLLRTRHPDLDLAFQRFSTGGGTFVTGLKNLDRWLSEFSPTLVFLNYGGNDANAGEKGIDQFRENAERCVERVKKSGARVILMTPQAADIRKAKALPALRRMLYAQTLLKLGEEHGWDVIDVFGPLEALQRAGEKKDPAFTILRDSIHPTREAYFVWAYALYRGVHPPAANNVLHLNATGAPIAQENCSVEDFKRLDNGVSFVRKDKILPLLPPPPLPPLEGTPLLKLSHYWLQLTDLPKRGDYEVLVEGKLVGTATEKQLAFGVNLNELAIKSGRPAPWAELVERLWNGKDLEQIGKTAWRYEVRLVAPK